MYGYVLYDVRKFILGGKAEFSILQEPNIEYEYIVKRNQKGNCWFVSVLRDGNYVYGGYIDSTLNYRRGTKGNLDVNDTAIKGLLWVLRHRGGKPPVVKIKHRGKCSVCNRKLKDELSVQWGIGPVCRKKLGL